MAQTAGHCSDQKDLPWPTVYGTLQELQNVFCSVRIHVDDVIGQVALKFECLV